MTQPLLHVTAEWDAEAAVWVAGSEDVPGLVTEADTIEHLMKKLTVMVPELLKLNRQRPTGENPPIELLARAIVGAAVAG